MTEARHQLDTTGMVCPLPILLTAKEIIRLEPGEVLEVIGDDPAILDDMPVYCLRAGHELVAMDEDGKSIRCLIRKLQDD